MRWMVTLLGLAAIISAPVYAALEQRLTGSPTLARWAARITERQAQLRLAERKAIPDLTVTAGEAGRRVPTGSLAAPEESGRTPGQARDPLCLSDLVPATGQGATPAP